ncbi:GNAT family N-acetyltransferase [Palaeococcus ferrophilus]|uniref:GNAT family N-acetyltransferase n=1 Tax=Palaeococcus ferrophilus TaxID=83868 RepID=UPI00064F1B5E|nr:GNAT family N-acetyltransferase [Palaeococcus ferrophilus]
MEVKVEPLDEWNEEVLNQLIQIYMRGYEGLREYGGENVPYARRYLSWCWRNGKIFVARIGERIVGFAVCMRDWEHALRGEKVGYIGEFVVDREYQGHRIGRKLMEACLNYLKGSGKVVLEVGEKNENAIRFYEHWGFRRLKKDGKWIVMVRGD